MSIDVGLTDGSQPGPLSSQPHFSLDDGYYWFLHPFFERLAATTGQYVDLFGDAVFEGANLDCLEQMLTEARALVESKPERWSVHVGTTVRPTRRELYCEVVREQFVQLLQHWQEVVKRARVTGYRLVCFG